MAKRYCPDPENAPRAGGKVIITCSNNVQTSKKEKKLLGEDTDTGREERRTGVVVDGDEETKVAEHKPDFGRKQFKALSKIWLARLLFFVLDVVVRGRWQGGRKIKVRCTQEKRHDTYQKPHRTPTEPTGISLPSQTPLLAPSHPPSSTLTHNRSCAQWASVSPACHYVPKTRIC